MATQTQATAGSEQEMVVEQNVQQLQALYADAPDLGKVALEHVLPALQSELAARPEVTNTQSAGRIGSREGNGTGRSRSHGAGR